MQQILLYSIGLLFSGETESLAPEQKVLSCIKSIDFVHSLVLRIEDRALPSSQFFQELRVAVEARQAFL
jgi:hypothetical protein